MVALAEARNLNSSKSDRIKTLFDSPSIRVAENIRFDKFVKEISNRDSNLYESFNTLHALSDQGPITRLIFATSKLRSSLECQINGFDQKTYSSFFSTYIMSTDSTKNLIEYFKEYHRRDSVNWNQDKLPDLIEKSTINQNPDKKYLVPEAYNSLSQLNHLTYKFSNGGLSTGLEDFYYKLNSEVVKIPDSFKELDIRQKASDWVETSLYLYIYSIFSIRRKSEINQIDIELTWNDFELSKLFSKKSIQHYLKAKLQNEISIIEKVGEINKDYTENIDEHIMSINRSDPDKINWEKSIVNENALKKLLAFESFAHTDHGQKNREFIRDIHYLQDLVKEATSIPEEKKTYSKLEKDSKKSNLDLNAENFIDLDNINAYITDVISARKKTDTESIRDSLSKTLNNLSKRIDLYK